jgi:hypothetical protein
VDGGCATGGRLRRLERFGVVERSGARYVLSPSGRALEPVVFGMAQWGAEWMFGDPQPEELDAQLLVWWMHSRVDTSGLDGDRHVLHLRFFDDARRSGSSSSAGPRRSAWPTWAFPST